MIVSVLGMVGSIIRVLLDYFVEVLVTYHCLLRTTVYIMIFKCCHWTGEIIGSITILKVHGVYLVAQYCGAHGKLFFRASCLHFMIFIIMYAMFVTVIYSLHLFQRGCMQQPCSGVFCYLSFYIDSCCTVPPTIISNCYQNCVLWFNRIQQLR